MKSHVNAAVFSGLYLSAWVAERPPKSEDKRGKGREFKRFWLQGLKRSTGKMYLQTDSNFV